MDLESTKSKVANWANERDLKDEIMRSIPFNPLLVKQAMSELLSDINKVKSFGAIAEFFESDPTIKIKFFEKAKEKLLSAGKFSTTIRDITFAVGVLSIPGSRDVLNELLSDEIINKFKKLDFIELQIIWKEIWATAFSCKELAKYKPQLNPLKAYSAGLMTNIGKLIMVNLFKHEYFTKCEFSCNDANNDSYNINGMEYLKLEESTFGINHAELGFWVLEECNLDRDISLATLYHEENKVEPNTSLYIQIIMLANKIAKLFLMKDRFNVMCKSKEEKDKKFEVFDKKRRNLETSISIEINKFLDCNIDTESFLENVETDVKSFQKNINGKISLIENSTFIDAFNILLRDRDKFINELCIRAENDNIVSRLPFPISNIYNNMLKSNNQIELTLSTTNLIDSTISFLISIFMGILLEGLQGDHEKFKTTISSILSQLGLYSQIDTFVLSSIGSIPFSIKLINFIEKNQSVKQLTEFYSKFSGVLNDIIKIRNNAKQNMKIIDPEKFISDIGNFMTNWASINYKYVVITQLDYSKFEKTFNVTMIDLMGTTPMEARKLSKIKLPNPTGSGVYMIIDNHWQYIPDFLTYQSVKNSKKQFYITEEIKTGNNDFYVRLNCEEDKAIIWPDYKKAEN